MTESPRSSLWTDFKEWVKSAWILWWWRQAGDRAERNGGIDVNTQGNVSSLCVHVLLLLNPRAANSLQRCHSTSLSVYHLHPPSSSKLAHAKASMCVCESLYTRLQVTLLTKSASPRRLTSFPQVDYTLLTARVSQLHDYFMSHPPFHSILQLLSNAQAKDTPLTGQCDG